MLISGEVDERRELPNALPTTVQGDNVNFGEGKQKIVTGNYKKIKKQKIVSGDYQKIMTQKIQTQQVVFHFGSGQRQCIGK